MREVVDDRPHRELALHVKRRLEVARRQQEPVDAPKAQPFDLDEQARAAFAAGDAGTALQFPGHWVAADDLDRVGRIDGFRDIGAAMHRLAIVTMAEELDDRLGGDFDLDRSAAALDFRHSFLLRLKKPPSPKAAPCARSSRNVGQPDRVLADAIARHTGATRETQAGICLAATSNVSIDAAQAPAFDIDEEPAQLSQSAA